jgi:rSAM/selenodomain-associated transferase 1
MADGRRSTIAVLAKAPIAGFAKTRLAPRLGAEGAAALHALLVERTLAAAAAAGFDRVVLWCAPSRADFRGVAVPPAVALHDQPEGDLGARLRAALAAHLADGPVVIVGTDAPALSAPALAEARAALAGGPDALLVPADDGGYAAIGVARAREREALEALLAGVPWGTGAVLAVTRERLRLLGWTWRELPAVRDVDLPADVDWLLGSGLLTGAERERMAPYVRAAPAERRTAT